MIMQGNGDGRFWELWFQEFVVSKTAFNILWLAIEIGILVQVIIVIIPRLVLLEMGVSKMGLAND